MVPMMAVAKEAGFSRGGLLLLLLLLLLLGGGCSVSGFALALLPPLLFPVDAEAESGSLHVFRAARARISAASSAADFLVGLSSSDERLDDMMVSRVL